MEKINIAVIGLGPAGLAALKTLREEGFSVVAFERRSHVGGLWSFSNNTTFTSALDGMVSNVSKFVSGCSDFPIPKDYPAYLTSESAAEYLEAYATHFGLHQHIQFNTTVKQVVRNTSDSAWNVYVTSLNGDSVLSFDKVVLGHGCEGVPKWPSMPNRGKFRGIVIHGQAYRDPAAFQGKKVLVVGNGNTACEISLSLCKQASKVYQSYRRGRTILSRYRDDGLPLDAQFSWPVVRLKYALDYAAPWLMRPLLDWFSTNNMISVAARSEPLKAGTSKSERWNLAKSKMLNDWHLLPCASMAHLHPVVQEDYIPALRRQDIIPLQGFQDFIDEKQVLTSDSIVVEVDAVIFCTGYKLDWNIMPCLEVDGACGIPLQTVADVSRWTETRHGDHSKTGSIESRPHIPRLFHMIFPPRWASSIAVLSWMAPQENVWCVSELASMAVAQIWAAETAKSLGLLRQSCEYRSPALLPSMDDMNAQVDSHHAWFRKEWEEERSMYSGYVQGYSFYRFLHNAAGTGLYDNLDHMFTGRGWKLWWNDHELWTWLTKGPMNSYSWRLFETNPEGIPGCGRKAWPQAREALQEAYHIYEDHKRKTLERIKKD